MVAAEESGDSTVERTLAWNAHTGGMQATARLRVIDCHVPGGAPHEHRVWTDGGFGRCDGSARLLQRELQQRLQNNEFQCCLALTDYFVQDPDVASAALVGRCADWFIDELARERATHAHAVTVA